LGARDRTDDEVVLALAFYFDHGQVDDVDPRVIELSGL
jgi:hypothetical protein